MKTFFEFSESQELVDRKVYLNTLNKIENGLFIYFHQTSENTNNGITKAVRDVIRAIHTLRGEPDTQPN